MILYRGGYEKNKRPKPDEYPGVFASITRGGASNYGSVISEYRTKKEPRLLAKESPEAVRLIVKSDPDYYAEEPLSESALDTYFVEPTSDWVDLLIEEGYDGLSYLTSDGMDVFLFDPRILQFLR